MAVGLSARIAAASALLLLSTNSISHSDASAAALASTAFISGESVNRVGKGDLPNLWVGRPAEAMSPLSTTAILEPGDESLLPRTSFEPAPSGRIVLGGLMPSTAPLSPEDDVTLALAYAPARGDLEAPFRAVIADPDMALPRVRPAFVPSPAGDHAWVANALPSGITSADQQRCLAEAIYFEARGESERGRLAVAQVIMNRVKNPAYPDTICGVVYQSSERQNACQFSFACDGIPERMNDQRAWAAANALAVAVTTGRAEYLSEIGSSTNFHTTAVSPRWASSANMIRMARIGDHIFYKTRGGGLQ